MELALKVSKLVDKWCLVVYVFSLAVIFIHFMGFIKVGRFRKRFLPDDH